jgi:hypothetical protein
MSDAPQAGDRPPTPLHRHVQPPRSWVAVAIRAGLALLVLAAVVWAAEYRQRISPATLERGVSRKLHASPATCSDHSRNGSEWACLVGRPPDPDCIVVDVSITGSWSIAPHQRSCHYP